MKTTINIYQFREAFLSWDTYKNNFSYEGLGLLYDYLTELEEDTGEEMELDVVAICCDFTEYESLKELQESYNNIQSLEELQDNTTVLELENGGLIIQNY